MRCLALVAVLCLPAVVTAQKQPFNASALLQVQRLSDPQVSPDGLTVAFSVSQPDIAANKSAKSIWTVPVAGGTPRKIAGNAERPRWAPDGKRIFYTGSSGGQSQIWRMNPDGAPRRRSLIFRRKQRGRQSRPTVSICWLPVMFIRTAGG